MNGYHYSPKWHWHTETETKTRMRGQKREKDRGERQRRKKKRPSSSLIKLNEVCVCGALYVCPSIWMTTHICHSLSPHSNDSNNGIGSYWIKTQVYKSTQYFQKLKSIEAGHFDTWTQPSESEQHISVSISVSAFFHGNSLTGTLSTMLITKKCSTFLIESQPKCSHYICALHCMCEWLRSRVLAAIWSH